MEPAGQAALQANTSSSFLLAKSANVVNAEEWIMRKHSSKAVSLADKVTPHEQAVIRAVARRYAAAAPPDRKPLDQAYADAMAEAARAFPTHDSIQVLYAEALMDLSPWDYWQAGGTQPKGRSPR
jgi:hypothetical protein